MVHLHIIYLLNMVIFQFAMLFYQIVNQHTLGEQRNFSGSAGRRQLGSWSAVAQVVLELNSMRIGFNNKKQNANSTIPTCSPVVNHIHTSSTAQGGGGSFKNRKPIGEVCCCESEMAERIHWWTERCLRSPLFLSLSLTIYPPANLSSMYLSIYICLSIHLSTVPVYLSTCLSVVQCHSV